MKRDRLVEVAMILGMPAVITSLVQMIYVGVMPPLASVAPFVSLVVYPIVALAGWVLWQAVESPRPQDVKIK